MEIVVFIIIVIGSVLCYKLSTLYNQQVEEKYGEGCINWWWSAGIAVSLTATLFTIGESAFWICFSLTLLSVLISSLSAYHKMTGWGATSKEALLGSLAQVASAIGIAAAIIFILLLFSDKSNKRKRR